MLVQRHATTIRPLTTAHLAQTMTLLELTAGELRQKIEAELSSNPALELIEERRCPTCHRILTGSAPCPFCSRPQTLTPDQPIVFVSPREYFNPYSAPAGEDAIDDAYTQVPEVEELPQYVLRQIAPDLQPKDRPIVAHILTNLDEDGLLAIPLVEIARYHHVLPSKVQEVLRMVQRAEPVGVGSPSPKEALIVQLEVLSETQQIHPMAIRAIEEGMDLLSRHRYKELGQLLKISTAQAREVTQFIAKNLNPYPARTSWGDIVSASQPSKGLDIYHFPDIIITRLNDREDSPLVVEVAMPISGTLRVNPLFKEAIDEAPDHKSDEWKAALEQASLLVKCLQQRNHTIVRLMQRLCVLQRNFIINGNAHIIPLTRASLSKELEVHESTISRAVSGKAVQLPNSHIVPLAVFFDRSLHIRTAMKEIIENETHPLSDTEIGVLLAKDGFPVARRTVAKYRAIEGILPAHLRKAHARQIHPSYPSVPAQLS